MPTRERRRVRAVRGGIIVARYDRLFADIIIYNAEDSLRRACPLVRGHVIGIRIRVSPTIDMNGLIRAFRRTFSAPLFRAVFSLKMIGQRH